MKTKLTFLSLAFITLLSSCYHTTIRENIIDDYDDCSPYGRKGVMFTNTSRSKYLEVTVKYQENSGHQYTSIINLKPGQIKKECKEETAILSIVGEREITGNE
jgi:hypothetical protein